MKPINIVLKGIKKIISENTPFNLPGFKLVHSFSEVDFNSKYIIVTKDSDNILYALYASEISDNILPGALTQSGCYAKIFVKNNTIVLKDFQDRYISVDKILFQLEGDVNGLSFFSNNKYLRMFHYMFQNDYSKQSFVINNGIMRIYNKNPNETFRTLTFNKKDDQASAYPDNVTDFWGASDSSKENFPLRLYKKVEIEPKKNLNAIFVKIFDKKINPNTIKINPIKIIISDIDIDYVLLKSTLLFKTIFTCKDYIYNIIGRINLRIKTFTKINKNGTFGYYYGKINHKIKTVFDTKSIVKYFHKSNAKFSTKNKCEKFVVRRFNNLQNKIRFKTQLLNKNTSLYTLFRFKKWTTPDILFKDTVETKDKKNITFGETCYKEE